MSNLYDATPSSLRKPVESSRFAYDLMTRSNRPVMMTSGPARAAALSKSRFARLPQEPEDARMTGVTRSLQRRLLALNMKGSRVETALLFESKIA
jgi:hypothetical protein